MPRIPITVVVVDTGPLISLAVAGRLDLLDAFSRPVKVPDVIRGECLRYPDRLGFEALQAWFDSFDGRRLEILDTPLIDIWKAAVLQEDAGDTTHPSSQIGDAAVTYVLSRLPHLNLQPPVALVLLDDAPFGDGPLRERNPEVHALSTRAFLQVLQNYGRIHSALDIIKDIVAANRAPARYMVDRPGTVDRRRTSWTQPLDEDEQTGPKLG